MDANRQEVFDFVLPAEEAARRRRIRELRSQFLTLLESIPETGLAGAEAFTPGQIRAVKRTLKRLLKSDRTGWDGVGVLRINEVAADWLVGERTLRRHLAWARSLAIVETSISTDRRGRKHTTLQYLWRSLANRLRRPIQEASGGEQPATATPDQPATRTDQPATRTDQPATAAGCMLTGKTESPTTPSESWRAVAVFLNREAPQLSLRCLHGPQSRGVSPEQVLAIGRHWRSKPGAWGVGALYRRIETAYPETSAADGWPPPKAVRQARPPEAIEESIRYRVLHQYRPAPGATIDQIGAEREQLVAAALAKFHAEQPS